MDILSDVKGYLHKVRLFGEVGPPEDYGELFDLLDIAQVSDDIYIYINTVGGQFDTTVGIIEAIRRCQATVTTIAEGYVASAGSLIFFAGHQHYVGEFCEVMIHDASTGYGGKFNEMEQRSLASSKTLSKLYHEVYSPYLTKKEINRVLKGRDLYLNSEELIERLEANCGEVGNV